MIAELKIAAELRGIVRGEIVENALMRDYTTMKVGGPADVLFKPADKKDLIAALEFTDRKGLPRLIVGGGSNLIVKDGGVSGLTILLNGVLEEIAVDGETIRAGAGAALPKLARIAARESLAGLEWAVSIPGTLGGAIAGNAGAFGTSVADVFIEGELWLGAGKIEKWTKDKFRFSYRSANLPKGAVILSATLKLKRDDKAEIEKRMNEMTKKRKTTQPLTEHSSGSVFKNPPQTAAGKLIDDLGLKGKTRGGAKVSEKHANFIVNTGDATASDIIGLIEEIRETVRTAYGVELEPEVQIVGREVAP